MNSALRFSPGTDTVISQWAKVVPVGTGSFVRRGFASERLKAFRSRFSPSRESLTQRISNVALTIGAYAGIAVAFRAISTTNVLPLLQAFHLHGV
jgi:hypothetical protein